MGLTKQEIIDGNIIILKFSMKDIPPCEKGGWTEIPDYHNDWNYLIPVMKKCHWVWIEPSGRDSWKWNKGDRFKYCYNENHILNDEVIEVWKSVVNWIKWYNQQIEKTE